MSERVTVIGGGHGLAAVLAALRDEPHELAVVVTVADDGGSSGELRRRRGGPAVGDLRRALIALAGDHSPLARALARPVTVEGFGRHPLGNLLIRSLADVFGDLTRAAEWLGLELGIRARVLPATIDNPTLVAEVGRGVIVGESAIGTSATAVRRLGFSPARPRVTAAAIEAIATSDHVLLAPGSLFTSVLAACALPDMVSALAATAAPTVWISNLQGEPGETAGMSALSHLAALQRHGVRVDAVLYDPGAQLAFAPRQLARRQIEAIPCSLCDGQPGIHDPVLLRRALRTILAGSREAAGAASRSRGQSATSRPAA
ncbi:MAG: YvcK family protein [Mycobacteriaceae bacterium]|nr:YvcK family protein [Mycobacteriaceae bacterium]